MKLSNVDFVSNDIVSCVEMYENLLQTTLDPGGRGALKYNVIVSRRDQENTVKGLFLEMKKCARIAHLGVQNRQFSPKRVPFSKSFWLHNLFRG